MPNGKTATLSVRPFNPYATEDAPTLYGYTLTDGEISGLVTVRPGNNPEDAGDLDDVWVDVSNLKTGTGGLAIYNIAQTYAHNTDRIFIGDPAGLTTEALRRRTEQMLSSAFKFGTTRHLAPHPRQIEGDAKLGIAPLEWTYGDDLANIQPLIETSLRNYRDVNPLTFEPSTGRYLDSEGNELDGSAISLIVRGTGIGETGAGRTTLQRNAIFESLVREGSGTRSGEGSGAGILERLVGLSRQFSGSTNKTFYSRAAETVKAAQANAALQRQQFQPLANQSTAKALNATLVNYGLGQDWSNAYEAVKLPDALSGVRAAIQTAFGRDVRPIAPTAAKFNIFNGVYIPSQPNAVYVNVSADVGFINITGHELWHVIKRQRPDLIEWYLGQSRQFYKDLPAYQTRLNALLQPEEKAYDLNKAEEELEADFMGDPLVNPEFLQKLADASPEKFKALLTRVRVWLHSVIGKLKGLDSSKEVTDVKALQAYLKEVLVAFAAGKDTPAAPRSIAPAFSRGTTDQTNTPAFKKWFGASKVVDADGRHLVMYHGTSHNLDFSKFKVGARGAWFSSDQEVASDYSMGNDNKGLRYNPDNRRYDDVNSAARVMPTYLRISNPYTLTLADRARVNVSNYAKAQRELFAEIRAKGFDGILWNDNFNKEWVVLGGPEQIKSATGNTGSFDASNPDIRFSAKAKSKKQSKFKF